MATQVLWDWSFTIPSERIVATTGVLGVRGCLEKVKPLMEFINIALS
jgi:hypothetical protein